MIDEAAERVKFVNNQRIKYSIPDHVDPFDFGNSTLREWEGWLAAKRDAEQEAKS